MSPTTSGRSRNRKKEKNRGNTEKSIDAKPASNNEMDNILKLHLLSDVEAEVRNKEGKIEKSPHLPTEEKETNKPPPPPHTHTVLND